MMTGWTLKGHWLNLIIFLSGLAGLLSAQAPDTWEQVPGLFTPKNVLSMLIAAGAYARSINTERPRDSHQERRTDPPADQRGDPPKTD